MTNPLDELRNTTKSIHQKQEENLKKTKEERLAQQQLLAKNSAEHQQKVQDEAHRLAEKSKKIKVAIMTVVVFLLTVLFAFSVRMVMTGAQLSSSGSTLVSSDRMELDAKDSEYVPLKKFIKKTLTDFRKKRDLDSVPWYSSLPVGRKERYLKIMVTSGVDESWSIHLIEKDPKRERFSVICEKDKKSSLTFDIVYDDEMEFRVVKVY